MQCVMPRGTNLVYTWQTITATMPPETRLSMDRGCRPQYTGDHYIVFRTYYRCIKRVVFLFRFLQGCVLYTRFVDSGYGYGRHTELTEVPGTGMDVVQNSQKFRVRVLTYYRTHRSSGYCDTGVQNSQKFRAV